LELIVVIVIVIKLIDILKLVVIWKHILVRCIWKRCALIGCVVSQEHIILIRLWHHISKRLLVWFILVIALVE